MTHRPSLIRSLRSLIAVALCAAGFTGCKIWDQMGVSESRPRLSGPGSIGGSGSLGIQRFTTDRPVTPGSGSRSRSSSADAGAASPQGKHVPTSRIPPPKPGSIGGSGALGFSGR